MRARLFNNGAEVTANSFVERFVGAVCAGIVSSLRTPRPRKSISLELEGDRIALQVDSRPVELDANQGFAGTLVRDTVQGMIRNLKGTDSRTPIRIVVDVEEPSWPE